MTVPKWKQSTCKQRMGQKIFPSKGADKQTQTSKAFHMNLCRAFSACWYLSLFIWIPITLLFIPWVRAAGDRESAESRQSNGATAPKLPGQKGEGQATAMDNRP